MNTPSESAVRQKARRQNLILRKCRSRTPEHPAYGTYGLVTAQNVGELWGREGYGFTLADCNDYLSAK